MAVAVVAGALGIAACVSGLGLSSTEDEVIVLNGMSPYDFGTHDLNTTTGPVTFELTSQTPTDDDIITDVTKSGACNQFFVNGPPPLGSAGTFEVWCMPSTNFGSGMTACTPVTYQFMAAFHPTQQGMATCDLTFKYHAKASATSQSIIVRLEGSGAAQTIGMTVNPADLPMGDVPVGSSASFPIHVANTGTVTLNLNVTEANDTSGFLSVNPTSTFLTGGSAMDFMATCAPGSAGTFQADYTFTGSGSGGGSSGMTHVSCNGVTSNLNITTPVTFDPTFVGVPPANKTVTITNSGSAGVMINDYTLDNPAMTSGVSIAMETPPPAFFLAGGSSASVSLHYQAMSAHTGSLGQLLISASNGARNVTIFGDALPGDVATNPPSLEFGTVCAGTPKTLPVEIYASDVANVQLSGLTAPATPFTSNPKDLGSPQTLKGNHANGFTVMVTANPGSAGEFPGTLTFRTNLPNKQTVDVPIHVAALAGATAPSPSELHFGSLATGHTSGGKDVVFTNCGADPLMVTGAHLEGPAATDFTIVKPETPAMEIPPAGQETFTLVMTPQATGARTATLVIEFAGGPATVQLDGTGFGPGNDVDRETYYACSASGGRARDLWPVALVLVFVRRRRKR